MNLCVTFHTEHSTTTTDEKRYDASCALPNTTMMTAPETIYIIIFRFTILYTTTPQRQNVCAMNLTDYRNVCICLFSSWCVCCPNIDGICVCWLYYCNVIRICGPWVDWLSENIFVILRCWLWWDRISADYKSPSIMVYYV